MYSFTNLLCILRFIVVLKTNKLHNKLWQQTVNYAIFQSNDVKLFHFLALTLLRTDDFCAHVYVTEPIVPDLTKKLNEQKRIKEEQDAEHSQQLQEVDEKFETMKELLLTENALLRQLIRSSFSEHCQFAPVGCTKYCDECDCTSVCISGCLSVCPFAHLNKSSAVAEMGDRLSTIDMAEKRGVCCAPFQGGLAST